MAYKIIWTEKANLEDNKSFYLGYHCSRFASSPAQSDIAYFQALYPQAQQILFTSTYFRINYLSKSTAG